MNELVKLQDSLNDLGLSKEDSLFLAFSAGPDSTALAYMLKSLGYTNIKLAYVNYHDSPYVDKEEELVMLTSKKTGYPLFKIDCYERPLHGFENYARQFRYSYFASLVLTHQAKGVLVAHHQDDVLETYQIQIARNSLVSYYGIRPLSKVENTLIYRPLLGYSKEELVSYLKSNDIPYYDDLTNLDTSRLRNRIRRKTVNEDEKNELLLEISKLNESLKQSEETVMKMLNAPEIDLDEYRHLKPTDERRVLYAYLKKVFPLRREKSINSLTNETYEFLKRTLPGFLYLVDNYYLYLTSSTFFISKYRAKGFYSYTIEKPGPYKFEEFEIDLTKEGQFNAFSYSYPLTIRATQKGDEISTNLKSKNVAHFLKSQKVPSYLRELYPVIVDKNGNIIYVPFYSDIKDHIIPFTLKLIH